MDCARLQEHLAQLLEHDTAKVVQHGCIVRYPTLKNASQVVAEIGCQPTPALLSKITDQDIKLFFAATFNWPEVAQACAANPTLPNVFLIQATLTSIESQALGVFEILYTELDRRSPDNLDGVAKECVMQLILEGRIAVIKQHQSQWPPALVGQAIMERPRTTINDVATMQHLLEIKLSETVCQELFLRAIENDNLEVVECCQRLGYGTKLFAAKRLALVKAIALSPATIKLLDLLGEAHVADGDSPLCDSEFCTELYLGKPIIVLACRRNNIELVRRLLASAGHLLSPEDRIVMLCEVLENSRTELFQDLVAWDPSLLRPEMARKALGAAMCSSDNQTTERVILAADLNKSHEHIVYNAVLHAAGQCECVESALKLILDLTDIDGSELLANEVLEACIRSNQIGLLTLLFTRYSLDIDPDELDVSGLIQDAVLHGHRDMVALLLEHLRPASSSLKAVQHQASRRRSSACAGAFQALDSWMETQRRSSGNDSPARQRRGGKPGLVSHRSCSSMETHLRPNLTTIVDTAVLAASGGVSPPTNRRLSPFTRRRISGQLTEVPFTAPRLNDDVALSLVTNIALGRFNSCLEDSRDTLILS
ncbi:uncharacterized protein MONBRDRAFT_25163 [Monosiga brevicollis MX1]|uniref:Uncharacterized protein n=1 Tax=Monosiga brevicollis TaxID=81824 RepID=A9UYL1_MONBE|nr:uncharacterized protein MONBRDRAFT_25163 [Monosiga brevicollis MX1]EDQ89482.1 predicted protein [Monosiga brevicollis MX1]|eukprot:XP_001745511.1 hypothetical protein [Monosiga brevicollis MX1]